jgi:hypothetical protein
MNLLSILSLSFLLCILIMSIHKYIVHLHSEFEKAMPLAPKVLALKEAVAAADPNEQCRRTEESV